MKQILLNSAKNNTDVNVESAEFITLSTKQRNIPNVYAEGDINYYEIYLKERNECKNYKLIFTIRPYMSNVLFNAFTEIVYNEGGISSGIITPNGELYNSHKKFFKSRVNNTVTTNALLNGKNFKEQNGIDRRYQLIRDTEYNHPDLGCLNYHCGLDIFNNHYLRSDGFFCVKSNKDNQKVYNTIADILIYSNGTTATMERETPGTPKTMQSAATYNIFAKDFWKNIFEILKVDPTDITHTKTIKQHLFNHENLLDINNAFTERIKDESGWIGFYNRSYLSELGKTGVQINKCMNDKNACDFIDMYPDRTLFSMTPKINDLYGGREEYNWKWYITYPYENTVTDSEGVNFDFFDEDGIKIIWANSSELYVKDGEENYINKLADKNYYNVMHENLYVYFRTKCKHNLKEGDVIRIKHDNGDFAAQVLGLGDINKEREKYYFFISYDDLANEFGENRILIEDSNNPQGVNVYYIQIPKNLKIAKLVNGEPCKYYVRKFKKLKGLSSTLNKVGFSRTIYGDPVAQILFNENVNFSGLKDNLGRDLSEVYLTILKNNTGWDDYYFSGVTHPLTVEYSHCFGRITSGFNFECEEGEISIVNPTADIEDIKSGSYFQKHNVRSLYNLENFGDIDLQEFVNVMGINYIPPQAIENNLTEKTEVFYGDFVEFSPKTMNEVVIEDIYHRFNTAQRETNLDDNNQYFNFERFKYDVIEFDDYDYDFKNGIGKSSLKGKADVGNLGSSDDDIPDFTVTVNDKGFRESVINSTDISESSKALIRDNIFPEGYFYKPHYKIKLKEFSETLSFDYDTPIVNRGNITIRKTEFFGMYEFDTNDTYLFADDDKIVLYYSDGRHYEYYLYQGSVRDKIVFSEITRTYEDIINNIECIFLKNRSIPDHAYYCADGMGKYIWRDMIKDTELLQTSDIYDRTYGNGAVYINTNINFYLRRQDPKGLYGVTYMDSKSGNVSNFIINGVNMELPDIDYKTQENYSICEI